MRMRLLSGTTSLVFMLLAGCGAKEFRAFEGPVNPETDVKLTVSDVRVRIVKVDGYVLPPALAEVSDKERAIWVRPRKGGTSLTLGIAPHDVVVRSVSRSMPVYMPPPGSSGPGPVIMSQSGSISTVRYPGSQQNQKVMLPATLSANTHLRLQGKFEEGKGVFWGFVLIDEDKESAIVLRRTAWEPNAGGGVAATPWNVWDIPDDQMLMKSTSYTR